MRKAPAWIACTVTHKIGFIESHAKFVMIQLTRPAAAMRADLLRKGIVVGRPFTQLDQMVRVTLGTD